MSCCICTSNITTGTPRRIDVDSTWNLHRYVEDQTSTNFHVISTYFFDVISLIEKFTSLPRTFFDITSLVEKIHVVSTYFFRCNFAGQKLLVVYTYFYRRNFDGRKIHVVYTYFFNEISMGKNSTSFVIKLSGNENLRGGFPLLVTLEN